jgi:hypothetical protein
MKFPLHSHLGVVRPKALERCSIWGLSLSTVASKIADEVISYLSGLMGVKGP